MNIKPHKVIGPHSNPYMLRWAIFKFRNWPRIYVHKFCRSDDDRGLHDHPWWFVSIILKGSYIEHLPGEGRVRRRWSVAFHRATDSHRVELFNGPPVDGVRQPIPVWTLFIAGRVVRQWGFWCKTKAWTLHTPDGTKQVPGQGVYWVPAELFYGCD